MIHGILRLCLSTSEPEPHLTILANFHYKEYCPEPTIAASLTPTSDTARSRALRDIDININGRVQPVYFLDFVVFYAREEDIRGMPELQTATDKVAETHGQARKRQLGEIRTRNQAYEQLYYLIQTWPLHQATDIFDCIRTGAGAEAVLRQVRDGDLLLQLSLRPNLHMQYELPYKFDISFLFDYPRNPYVESTLFKSTFGLGPKGSSTTTEPRPEAGVDSMDGVVSTEQGEPSRPEGQDAVPEWTAAYHTPFSAAEMVDHRIDSADVARWTSVHSDNFFLRKLLKLYFLQEYPFFSPFHRDHMLDDMVAGQDRFCSSLLINSTLANACHALATIEHRSEFWNPRNPGYQFLNEARRLWELESDRARITTMQAGCILAITFYVNGIDKLGNTYMLQSIELAKRKGLFSTPHLQMTDRKTREVKLQTAWALYTLQGFFQFHFLRQPYLDTAPRDPLPEGDEAKRFYGEIHVKYPLGQGLVPLYLGPTCVANAEIRLIMNEIARAVFTSCGNACLTVDQAVEFHAQLTDWYDRLPEPLTAHHIVLPTHLLMHMQYHTILMILFRSLIGVGAVRDQHPGFPDPEDIVMHSEVCVETLVHLFYRRHGFECYSPFLLYVLSQVALTMLRRLSLPNLPPPSRDAAWGTFVLCARAKRHARLWR
ncbi:hypothetical protein SODALDRAFT_349782 [Sodiomyces alkalinus F11]|uniref:Transcription factor domain-containing protein n=1 Tax=Sodiomyces alkalinus (strain CBS 110278 / VKM F-3762 / F11) TaxID=1314773 RepID=A0A3N2PYU2_SODAK|nr:hypothetical protein SODALDRAFT_349782 [Sodiomyces alkalinus F11]ROT39598.1 hypothetical protein SODALDRAFT_349782 [Sodiomyces alkalinus F11]